MSNTQSDITRICNEVRDLLLSKNAKYGDSALEPVRIMSKGTPVEQILVRIDDKLSRISRGTGLVGDDEDVITDLIGYFVLLKIALGRQNDESAAEISDRIFLAEYPDVEQIFAAQPVSDPWILGGAGQDTISFSGAADKYDTVYIAGDTQSFTFDDMRAKTDRVPRPDWDYMDSNVLMRNPENSTFNFNAVWDEHVAAVKEGRPMEGRFLTETMTTQEEDV